MRIGVDDDRQETILERVITKNIGDFGTDHGANPEIEQRPGCVFTRRSAAEIIARNEDFAAGHTGLIERKFGDWFAIRGES